MVQISITEFGPEILAAYAALFPGDEAKVPERLVQRFAAHPHGTSRFVLARDEDGSALGLIALLPTRLHTPEGPVQACQAIDTIVAPEARGKSLFVRMGRHLHEAGTVGEAVWGFPNALAARGWFSKRLAWTDFGQVPFLIRPLRTGFVAGKVHRALSALDVPLPILGPRVDVEEGFDEAEYDALWRQLSAGFPVGVDRSAQWLRWRLGNGKNYRVVTARDDKGMAAIVITILEQKHGARILYVMEAQARDPASGAALLTSELRRARDSGADLALAWCFPHSPNRSLYRQAGFWTLPPRIRPVEINFGGRALTAGTERLFHPSARWFLSYLDSDTV